MNRRKEPATEPEPVNYPLTWSFSHATSGIGHAPLSSIAPYVPIMGVLPTATEL